ncbi:MAG: hypothetical protein H5U05_08975 [Candidatus Aminicenantes bacterium]|nr:hypothetical protein [Candidatus Aminicenantes bacterium]
MLKADKLALPESIDGWKLTGPPQKVTRETIFDYMDGGGELYLAYRFNQLLVWHYQAQKENEEEILVEVYEMQHPDEAFGLLSLDWTGEAIRLNEKLSPLAENPICPPYTALYGEGLLRARVDNLYLRLLAPRETAEIKETILKIGNTIAARGSQPTTPEMLKVLKPKPSSGWQVKKDRTSYFHSHLILNSLHYLSHENILLLGPDCEGLYTEWVRTKTGQASRMMVIKYQDNQKASQALADFVCAYLPDKAELTGEPEKAIQVEDGWLGWKLAKNYLALIFEAPDEISVKELFSRLIF